MSSAFQDGGRQPLLKKQLSMSLSKLICFLESLLIKIHKPKLNTRIKSTK